MYLADRHIRFKVHPNVVKVAGAADLKVEDPGTGVEQSEETVELNKVAEVKNDLL